MTIGIVGAPSGSFSNLITAPVNGENVTGASVQQVAQGAADLSKRLFDTKAERSGDTFTGPVVFEDPIEVPEIGNGGGTMVITDNVSAAGKTIDAAKLELTSQPAAAANPGSNTLHATNIIKAGGWIESDGAGSVAARDSYGVSTVGILAGNVGWSVTMHQAMANSNYWVTANYQFFGGSHDSTNIWIVRVKIVSATAFELRLNRISGVAVDVTTEQVAVAFSVHGRQ